MTLELSNKNLNSRIYYSFPSQQQRFSHFDSTYVTVAIPRLLITFGKMNRDIISLLLLFLRVAELPRKPIIGRDAEKAFHNTVSQYSVKV